MKPALEMSDWELVTTEARMQSLMTARNERLKDAKERHKKIDFTNLNFLYLQAEVDNEIYNREKKVS